ncbi:hypothetical protein H0H93_003880 [Arthromyces matolae]|nr:hypothetical protein H0H93_003880 [Arthromyces matolae]
MMFGHNLNSHFGFYSPHPGYIAPNFIRAPHAVYPTRPPPPPVVSAPVHFVATQPGGPSKLLPTSSLPAPVPRTALGTNVENIITAPAQPNTQLSRCKPDLFWNGLLTSPAFNCHWEDCSFKLATQRLETDDEYHLLAVQHLKGHLNSDEHIYRLDKTTWQCLWRDCGRILNDQTVKNLRRHIFSNKHESDSVAVRHFCPVPACDQSFLRDYVAVAHLRMNHPGVPIPERPTGSKRQGENASQEPPAKRQRV